MIYYSSETGGFYNSDIHGDNIPADAVEITREEWQALLDGQAQGKIIVPGKDGIPELRDPEPSTPTVPAHVTMRQARLALLAAGHLDAVEQAFAGLPADVKRAAQIEWEYAGTVERGSIFTQQMAAMLQLDETALDALFMAAAKL